MQARAAAGVLAEEQQTENALKTAFLARRIDQLATAPGTEQLFHKDLGIVADQKIGALEGEVQLLFLRITKGNGADDRT